MRYVRCLKSLRALAAAILVGLIAGCAHQTIATTAPHQPLATIDILHLGGTWRVVVGLPEPVDQFVFYSTPQLPLRKSWRVVEENLRLTRAQRRDVIKADVPFSRFTLEVPADNRLFPGGYTLTQNFPDEGWVLYTGHFLGGGKDTCPLAHPGKQL